MPLASEPYYCSEQIQIPPELPDILKQFTKAAIRTQPADLLVWSAKYFRSLSRGEIPSVKDRLDMATATQKTDSGITLGVIKTLHKQLAVKKVVDLAVIEDKFKALSLPKEKFDLIVQLGGFHGEVEWTKFMSIMCSTISRNITETMSKVCEILTADPPGANARIPFEKFKEIYQYMASNIETDIPRKHVEEVCQYLETEWVRRQDGMVHPRNFTHPDCPRLSYLA